MKNNTTVIIHYFNINIDVDKKYKITELKKLLSNTYDKYHKNIKLIHEKTLLKKK
tara:strand:+ start:1158 stop:1322 length:165 start_codon:yes stop_codon:yes gene_type:complete